MCQASDLPAILSAMSTAVSMQCSNVHDATAAMAAIISYCTVQGYTLPSALASITISPGTFYLLKCQSFDSNPASLSYIGNNQTLSLTAIGGVLESAGLPNCAVIPIYEICGSIGCNINNCFCRPDVMSSAMDIASSSVNAACSVSAPGGANTALSVIVNYCVTNGFAVSKTFSGEPTGTGTATIVSPPVSPGTLAFHVLINFH
jgi:hypothetical protein